MLTKRQNMMEVIRGGNPDRFVKQYEGLTFVLNTPYQQQYPMMPEGPGAPTVKCGWGYYNSWPAGTPGAFPLHDPEHLVCPDITEWKKYVKAPDINYTAEDWKACQETIAGIDRNETMVATLIAPGVFEMCHYLCEIQNTMMNFYEEPEAMHELIEYITEWELKWAEQICTYMKPDVVFHHDDWGTQKSTFISVDMFREFFMDSYKRIYGYYHDHGVELIIHHNDHTDQHHWVGNNGSGKIQKFLNRSVPKTGIHQRLIPPVIKDKNFLKFVKNGIGRKIFRNDAHVWLS